VKKLLPQKRHVTKAGAYGNVVPVFFGYTKIASICHTPGFKGLQRVSQKLARVLLYVFVQEQQKSVTSKKNHNKNKTYRLTHNKNKTAEAQLTDSFGEALHLGLVPQPGREQQKTTLKVEPELVGSNDYCSTATKAIRLLLTPDWEVSLAKSRELGAQQKQKAQQTIKIRARTLGELRLPQ
jgi:hypothetical protein